MAKISPQVTYQLRRQAEGNCTTCGKPRGADGTSTRCRSCTDKEAERHRLRRARRKAAGNCIECGDPASPYVKCSRCRQAESDRRQGRDPFELACARTPDAA